MMTIKTMIKVKLHCNWIDDISLKNYFNQFSFNLDYTWKDMLLVDQNYDYIVIFNHPQHNNFDPGRAILFQCEPSSTRKWWKYENLDQYYYVVNTDKFFNFITPHVYVPYKDIMIDRPPKNKIFGGIVSDFMSLEGHRLRKKFIDNYLSQLKFYDHYGRGDWQKLPNFIGPCNNKYQCLSPYKYHFNIENSFENNYFTEKLIDAILAECLCFYDGCTNIKKFINPEAYIKININNPDEALAQIISAIDNKEYEKRIWAIRKAKHSLLTDYNPLNVIYNAIISPTFLNYYIS